MKIFIAGATGVIGRSATAALVQAGHLVTATARSSDKAALVQRLGARPVEVDLYDAVALRNAVAGHDAVLRLTTKIPPINSMRNAEAWKENNRLRTEGARFLVDAALAETVPTYIHESVTFVYADGGSEWLSEESPVDANSKILQAALEGEQEAERFTSAGARGIVLRFAGFYGPAAPSTTDMLKMAQKRMFPQVGPGTNYFSSIYVADAATAVAAALLAPAGIYNVCDDEPVPFADYQRALTDAVGAPRPLHLPAVLGKWMFGEVWNYFSRSQRVSNKKLKDATGWKPSVPSVREGALMTAKALGNDHQAAA